MRTILILVLVLLIFGTSVAYAADSAAARVSAHGGGKIGSASTLAANTFTSVNTQAGGSGAARGSAYNSVAMNSPGAVGTGGGGSSVSYEVDSPLATIGVSNSVAISVTVGIQSPNTPPGATENTGATDISVESNAGGIGSSANAQTAQTGTGYQISKNTQSNVQFNLK